MIVKKLFLVIIILLLFPIFSVSADCGGEIQLPIVMYHHISKRSSCWNDYVISPEEFRSDMEYLHDNGWESISLAELLAWQRGEFEMPEKPVMISFDDGFASTVEYAEPVMRELGFKGVVALIGSVCDKYSESGEYDPEWTHLSWEKAKEVSERGVLEVQCHTWDMHSMDNAAGCAKRWGESIAAYRQRLSGDLSKFINGCSEHGIDFAYTIAYPFGAYGCDTTEVVRDMDFKAAFTCTEEINLLTRAGDGMYHLGRFNRPHGISSENFFKKWENNA